MFFLRHLIFVLLILLLSACATYYPSTLNNSATNATVDVQSQSFHIVKQGDTLYAIARRYSVRVSDLMAWNNLRSSILQVGQRLRVSASSGTTASPSNTSTTNLENSNEPTRRLASGYRGTTTVPVTINPKQCTPPVNWQWPTSGQVVRSVSSSGRRGVKIMGQANQGVYAAANGTVMYSGDGLNGYRQLVIVQHNNAFLSAYANNQRRLVNEGAKVRRGQQIALMGYNDTGQAALHFEIRCHGKAVDPFNYLPNVE